MHKSKGEKLDTALIDLYNASVCHV